MNPNPNLINFEPYSPTNIGSSKPTVFFSKAIKNLVNLDNQNTLLVPLIPKKSERKYIL